MSGSRSFFHQVTETGTVTKKIVAFIWTHPANERERVRALLRALSFQARAKLLHQRTLARLGDRSMVWVDLHRTAASKVLYANPPIILRCSHGGMSSARVTYSSTWGLTSAHTQSGRASWVLK